MSVVELIYSDLETAASNAVSACNELTDYSDTISRKVMAKLNVLPGDDSNGYISYAVSAASGKKNELLEKADVYLNCSRKITTLCNEARTADAAVAKKMEILTDPYNTEITVASVFRGLGNLFYDFFCVDAANWISDHVPLADAIMEWIRNQANDLSHWYETIIRDWFKYGDGQYAMNKTGAIVVVLGAIAGLCAAVALIGKAAIATAVVAVVAGTLVLIFAAVNAVYTFIDNNRAERQAGQGKKGLAHYYGETEGFSSYYKRHDMGSWETNERWGIAGTIFDLADKAAQLVYTVAMILGTVDILTKVMDKKGNVTGHEIKLDRVRENLKIQKEEAKAIAEANKNKEKILGIFEKSDPGKGWKGAIESLEKVFKDSKVIAGMTDFLDGMDLKDMDHISMGDLKIGTLTRVFSDLGVNILVCQWGDGGVDGIDIAKKVPDYIFDTISVFSEIETKTGVWEKYVYKFHVKTVKTAYDTSKENAFKSILSRLEGG